MKKYRCDVCGYVYDEAAGGGPNDEGANVPFDELPGDWTCPVCGAPKDDFSIVE
ncbi:MAG: rubredoxin [Alistipes sp.]|jgi:rubredoxin|nr:rubredoxin [Alistipes sp.]